MSHESSIYNVDNADRSWRSIQKMFKAERIVSVTSDPKKYAEAIVSAVIWTDYLSDPSRTSIVVKTADLDPRSSVGSAKEIDARPASERKVDAMVVHQRLLRTAFYSLSRADEQHVYSLAKELYADHLKNEMGRAWGGGVDPSRFAERILGSGPSRG